MSDKTRYTINLKKKTYYKHGGFEFSGNMCSGNKSHYESHATLQHKYPNDNNSNTWQDVAKDFIAKVIYNYISAEK